LFPEQSLLSAGITIRKFYLVTLENSVQEMNSDSAININSRHLIDFRLFKDLLFAADAYISELGQNMDMKIE
jgi:hypothetical protein